MIGANNWDFELSVSKRVWAPKFSSELNKIRARFRLVSALVQSQTKSIVFWQLNQKFISDNWIYKLLCSTFFCDFIQCFMQRRYNVEFQKFSGTQIIREIYSVPKSLSRFWATTHFVKFHAPTTRFFQNLLPNVFLSHPLKRKTSQQISQMVSILKKAQAGVLSTVHSWDHVSPRFEFSFWLRASQVKTGLAHLAHR